MKNGLFIVAFYIFGCWKECGMIPETFVMAAIDFGSEKLIMQCLETGVWNMSCHLTVINTLRPRQNGRHFADDISKCIFLNENLRISLTISLKFVPKVRSNNIPTLVQIMAWRRPGDKPLSEPMIVSLLTHKCVTRPQWVHMNAY